eukprot:4435112-Amphidinium_carterae.1
MMGERMAKYAGPSKHWRHYGDTTAGSMLQAIVTCARQRVHVLLPDIASVCACFSGTSTCSLVTPRLGVGLWLTSLHICE